tara:strand:- start:269 stop:733 length:465 start_codon:yes stop_codon:yes gene_type:complete
MFFFNNIFKVIVHIIIFFILISCKFQEPYKNHGILHLKKRSELLEINKSNTNDVLKLIGHPHTVSLEDKDEWIFFERVLTKGDFIRLGQNVLEKNNVLVLKFNKYGILKEKNLFGKDSKNKVTFSENETKNEMSQKSFVEKFLTSLRNKMYGNK